MRETKTIVLIECRLCNGCYFGGDTKVILHPGDEKELPDEIYIMTKKVARCQSCIENEDRTRGGNRKKFRYQ